MIHIGELLSTSTRLRC